MKKLLVMLLVVSLLIGAGGCGQTNQIKQEYRIKQTKQGYKVIIHRQKYTFKNDIRIVWQDDQFRTHTIFWSSICGYFFFGLPFTESAPIILPSPVLP